MKRIIRTLLHRMTSVGARKGEVPRYDMSSIEIHGHALGLLRTWRLIILCGKVVPKSPRGIGNPASQLQLIRTVCALTMYFT